MKNLFNRLTTLDIYRFAPNGRRRAGADHLAGGDARPTNLFMLYGRELTPDP